MARTLRHWNPGRTESDWRTFGHENAIFLRLDPGDQEIPSVEISLRTDISLWWDPNRIWEANEIASEFDANGLEELHSQQLAEVRLRVTGGDNAFGLEPSVAREIARQNLFALCETPSGGWQLRMCVDERTASNDLRDVIEHIREHARAWVENEEPQVQEDDFPPQLAAQWDFRGWWEQEHAPSWAPKDFHVLDDGFAVSYEHLELFVLYAAAEVSYGLPYRNSPILNDVDKATRFICGVASPGTNESLDELELFAEIEPRLERANHFYETILGNPIGLTLDTGSPRSRVRGTHPRIAAIDEATGDTVPIRQLSATQARWAQIAFYLGGDGDPVPSLPDVVLIDEPELGFPPGIQRRISQGLVDVSKELGIQIVVATHSASLLDDPAVIPYRCSRNDDGDMTVEEVSTSDRDALTRLKVPISEELHLVRVVLVVEGQHEAVIFDELFGDEISRYRIKVLPIRGTRQLKHLAAAGELLFTYLEAPFVLLTDKTRSDPAQQALSAAAPHRTGNEAKKAIDAVFEPQSDEEQVVRAVLYRAAESGHIDRIKAVHGLEADDILEYLPCDHFIPDTTWDELKGLHAKREPTEPNDFKRWLELVHGAEFDDDNIRSAVQLLDSIPTEFTNVINTCGELSAQGGTS